MVEEKTQMTPMKTQTRFPHVIFTIKNTLYAIASEHVREIVLLPKVTSVPNMPPQVRGVINLRGSIIPLIDLRVKVGLSSNQSELDTIIQLLRDREQDHLTWLNELEACLREQRPFGLARDHHKCKFGLWYDQFKTDNSLLRMSLQRMDEPHRIIHATAALALEKAAQGDATGAMELVAERRRNELAALVVWFGEARRILIEHHREVVLVLWFGSKPLAVSVDLVDAVERIPEENIEAMAEVLPGFNGGLEASVAKRVKTNQTMLVLDDNFFLADQRTPEACLS